MRWGMSTDNDGELARGRPQDVQIDDLLRSAALELLSEVGLAAMTISEVARRANTTPPAFYRRYGDVGELVSDALDHEFDTMPEELTDQGSLRGDLGELVAVTSGYLTPRRSRILAGLVLAEDSARGPLAKVQAELVRRAESGLAKVISRAVERGELRPGSFPEVLARVPGALATVQGLLEGGHLSEVQQQALVECVLLPSLHFAQTKPTHR